MKGAVQSTCIIIIILKHQKANNTDKLDVDKLFLAMCSTCISFLQSDISSLWSTFQHELFCELVRMWFRLCNKAVGRVEIILGERTAKCSFSFHLWRRPFLKAQQQNEPLNGPFNTKGQRDERWICKKLNRPIFSTIKDVWMESTFFTTVREAFRIPVCQVLFLHSLINVISLYWFSGQN